MDPPGEPEPDDESDLAVDHPPLPDADWSAPTTPPPVGELTTTVLVENLEVPWDLAFAATGEAFVTERPGRILRFESGEVSAVASPPDVVDVGAVDPGSDERGWWVAGGEAGLLGVAVHPRYPEVPTVYAYYTYETDGDHSNKVVAYDAANEDPAGTARTIVDGIPGAPIHDGGRIAFGPRNYLWVTTGEAGVDDHAQDPASLGGKVLRVTPTGEPAPDNPDLGPGADPRVYSLGHRNPQGVTWLPDGTPVVTEHGPGGHDEVSVLVPGGNYGWPVARDADAYRGSEFRRPVVNTGHETWAPSGCVFYSGDGVPGLRNRLLVGGLRGQFVAAVTLTPSGDALPGGRRFDAGWYDDRFTATAHRLLDDRLGRVRLVTQGPDGALYAITSNRDGRASEPFPTARDDVLVRIEPA